MCELLSVFVTLSVSAEARWRCPSEVPTATDAPSGDNAMALIGSLHTRRALRIVHVSVSQITTCPSPSTFSPVYATFVPSGPNPANRNAHRRALGARVHRNARTRSPLCVDHTAAPPFPFPSSPRAFAASALVVRMNRPSGEKARPVTASACASSVVNFILSDGHATTRTLPSASPSARVFPPAVNAADLMSTSARATRSAAP
mmetsp:Transcript_8303/g.30361  ORF Transcript_8303/g.30361 Transcript_8303/m.30361 type:complete len:203 (-) Transcript_8303:59-667(-)